MQYSQEHLKTMVYAEFEGQTDGEFENREWDKGNWESTLVKESEYDFDL